MGTLNSHPNVSYGTMKDTVEPECNGFDLSALIANGLSSQYYH